MPRVTLLIGLPGSGKTTMAKKILKDDDKAIRVNRDDIRRMVTGRRLKDDAWQAAARRKLSELTRAIRDAAVETALRAGHNVVVDECNLFDDAVRGTNDVIRRLRLEGVEVTRERRYMNVDVEECVRRDAERPDHERVGAAAIRGMDVKNKAHGELARRAARAQSDEDTRRMTEDAYEAMKDRK